MKKSLHSIIYAIMITVVYICSQIAVQFIYAFVVYFRNLNPEVSYADALAPAILNINNHRDFFSVISIILAFFIVYIICCRRKRIPVKPDIEHITPFGYVVWFLFGVFLSICFYLVLFHFSLIGFNENAKIDIQYFLIGCFIVPIFEEWLFRNIIMKTLSAGMNDFFVVIVQAVLFAAIHSTNLQRAYTLIFAIFLGLVMILKKNLIVVTVIHIIFNTVGMGLFYCANMDKGLLVASVVFSFLFCVSVLVYHIIKHLSAFRRHKKQLRDNRAQEE